VLLYNLVKPLAKLGTKIFFRKIHCSNTHRIPKDKPMIIALNHPTGFMEPMLLAVLLSKPLYILVRGDVFRKPFYRKLLNGLNLVPIYRQRDDGLGAVKNNLATFSACFDSIKAGQVIMIFPEGRTILEKRLRPLQKGICRMAFGSIERYPELLPDLCIVPVGANFCDGTQARSRVMINFGEPLMVKDFINADGQQDNQKLLDTLTVAMSEHLVLIDQEEDEEWIEGLLTMHRSENPEPNFPVITADEAPLRAEKALTAKLSALSNEQKEVLATELKTYRTALEKHQVEDWAVAKKGKRGQTPIAMLAIVGLLTLPGRIFAWPMAALARRIKDQRVKRPEYYLPVWAGLSWLLFMFYYIFWLLVSIISGQWLIFGGALFLGGLAYGGLLVKESWEDALVLGRLKKLGADNIQALQGMRGKLVDMAFGQ
jgi:glycerol-3-phosphate O-acyltransferase / dihydroxyacetone phosphate acyltransferase